MNPIGDSLGFLIRLLQLRAFELFGLFFADYQVTPAAFSVFSLVVGNPGIRPGEVADELRVKPSNVAALVTVLVGAGLVERRTDASELRASMLAPTPAGAAAWDGMQSAHARSETALAKPLNPDELATLVALLRKTLPVR